VPSNFMLFNGDSSYFRGGEEMHKSQKIRSHLK